MGQYNGRDHINGQASGAARSKNIPVKRTDTSTLLDAVRERLDALMKERKRSGADVARSAGLGKGTLNAFLSGKSEDITLGSLFRVAAELGIHASDLLPEIKGSEPRRDPHPGPRYRVPCEPGLPTGGDGIPCALHIFDLRDVGRAHGRARVLQRVVPLDAERLVRGTEPLSLRGDAPAPSPAALTGIAASTIIMVDAERHSGPAIRNCAN